MDDCSNLRLRDGGKDCRGHAQDPQRAQRARRLSLPGGLGTKCVHHGAMVRHSSTPRFLKSAGVRRVMTCSTQSAALEERQDRVRCSYQSARLRDRDLTFS